MRKIFFLIFILHSVAASAQFDLEKYEMRKDSIINSYLGKDYFEFDATSLDSENFNQKDLLGKVTLINFWMKGCSPCMVEFEYLNEMYLRNKVNPNFQIISFTKDSPEIAEEIVQQYKILFPAIPVSVKECYRLNMNQGFPVNIIVDKDGKVIHVKLGGHIIRDKVEEQVGKFEKIMLEAL